MEQRTLEGAMVDTCTQCRGLWVDWFDGELVAVVKETAPLSFRAPVELPESGACPRCARTLAFETFAGHVVLLRCADCGGCFVPRASFNVLLDLDARTDADEEKRGALARLLLAIRQFFKP
jgi:Zn-finger nucleic acid-binding protein